MKLGAPEIKRGAKLSECGRYRYALTRTWDASAGEALFVMLNPSTADGRVDDPTIRKCIGFARDWGVGGIRVANLFALRATDPKELHTAHRRGEDAIGPLNIEYVQALALGAERVILAWGAHARPYVDHVRRVVTSIKARPLWCLGTTGDGQPRHPLMLAYSTKLETVKGVP